MAHRTTSDLWKPDSSSKPPTRAPAAKHLPAARLLRSGSRWALLAMFCTGLAGCSLALPLPDGPLEAVLLGAVLQVATEAAFDAATAAGPAPTFAAIESSLPPPPTGHGRLVVFSSPTNKRQDALAFSVDGGQEKAIGPWGFLFIDLTPDTHSIVVSPHVPSRAARLSIVTEKERLSFVSLLDYAPPLLVEEEDARRMLRACHHEFSAGHTQAQADRASSRVGSSDARSY